MTIGKHCPIPLVTMPLAHSVGSWVDTVNHQCTGCNPHAQSRQSSATPWKEVESMPLFSVRLPILVIECCLRNPLLLLMLELKLLLLLLHVLLLLLCCSNLLLLLHRGTRIRSALLLANGNQTLPHLQSIFKCPHKQLYTPPILQTITRHQQQWIS